MSRHAIVNIFLAVVALGLVGAVIVLERRNDSSGGSGAASIATSSTLLTTTLEPTTIPTTTLDPTTLPSTTLAATTTLVPTVPPTSAPPPTEPPTTLPPTTLPPPERGLVPVVVTSAGSTGERVGPTVYLLSIAGWVDVRGLNAAVPTTATVIYFADGFQNAAELLAVDMTLPVTAVAPLAAAPPVSGLGNAALVVYLGG